MTTRIRRTCGRVAVALTVALAACRGERLETRTFAVSNLRTDEVSALITPYVFTDRPEAPGVFSVTERAVTVRETPDNLDRIGRVLSEYDVASPSVRLHFHLIAGNGDAAPDPSIAEIEPELRKLFRFEGYRLLGEAVVLAQPGTEFSQSFQGPGQWGIVGEVVRPSAGMILLYELQLFGPPVPGGGLAGGLKTSVKVPEGQTVVLGSARDERGGAIFLAVRAESSAAAAPPSH